MEVDYYMVNEDSVFNQSVAGGELSGDKEVTMKETFIS